MSVTTPSVRALVEYAQDLLGESAPVMDVVASMTLQRDVHTMGPSVNAAPTLSHAETPPTLL